MPIKKQYIPAPLKSAVKGGYVTDTSEIFDEAKGKRQDVINQETDGKIDDIKGGSSKSIAQLDSHLNTLQQEMDDIEQGIQFDQDGTLVSEDGTDFSDPNKRGKVATIGAILDGMNDGVYDVSKRNPTGGPDSDGKFTLEYILTNANTLIPTSWRHGGMTISFVDSSDNKYVQFRFLLSGSFTAAQFANTDNWSVCEDTVLVESPEFVRVVLDNEGKIIEAVKVDGTKLLPAGVEVHNKITFEGNETTIVENPEFVEIKLDGAGHVLWGVQKDGNIYFGAGVPQQVINYIEGRIKDLSLDEYEDIVAFLGNLITGDETLQQLLDKKVDGEYVENPEFVQVLTDSEGRLTEGTKKDGTKVIGGDAKILGSIDIHGVTYTLMQNPEWIRVIVDAQKRILCGIKVDGSIYLNSLVEIPTIIKNLFNAVDIEIASLEERIEIFEKIFLSVESPEYISAETDSVGRVLGGRKPDGKKVELLGLSTPFVETDGATFERGTDQEDRIDLKLDSNNKVLSGRKKDGTLVEDKIEVNNLKVKDNIVLPQKSKLATARTKVPKEWNLPKYGRIDFVEETFYLTSDAGYSDKTGVVQIQELPDTDANALLRIPLSHYYVKDNSLIENQDGTYTPTANSVKLNFWPANEVEESGGHYYVKSLTKVGNNLYYTDTLTETNGVYSVNDESVKVDVVLPAQEQETLTDAIEVTQIKDVPPIKCWAVNKKDLHNIKSSTDFGKYLSGTQYVTIKYQGNSTQGNRKRNFRITFYKNSTYAKKNKVKFGELLRLSGFNMKSEQKDATRIKEVVLYRLFIEAKDSRNVSTKYPWTNDNTQYSAATGIINGFNIRCEIGGEFYGVYYFSLKKDEDNYLIDKKKQDGIFIQAYPHSKGAPIYYSDFWQDYQTDNWEDQMNDDPIYVDTNGTCYTADKVTKVENSFYVTSTLVDGQVVPESVEVQNQLDVYLGDFYDFINGSDFTKANIPERMYILDWLDYFIMMQVFIARDNYVNNVILYTGKDKRKWSPFVYDLDLAMAERYKSWEEDVLTSQYQNVDDVLADVSIWNNLKDLYWDEIVNRYSELRKGILSDDYIENMINYSDNIPEADKKLEDSRWNLSSISGGIARAKFIYVFKKRVAFLDTYFI